MFRPSKKDYYLNIAKAVSQRSTCLRRRYGAVIVKNDEIIGTGYNGSPRGEMNCIDNPDGCIRAAKNIPHGSNYELCCAVHAEANAIISAGRKAIMPDHRDTTTLYLYGFDVEKNETIKAEPCMMCARLIKQVGIKHVVCSEK